MPCTWTGYGEPLPRLPINTGERTAPKGDDWRGRKKDKRGGGEFVFEGSEARAKQKKEKEQDRRGKRRATVAPPPAPPPFLPATTSSPTIPPPSALPTPAEPEREKRNRTEQRGKKKTETAGSVQRRRRKDSRATAWNHRHFSSRPLPRPPSTTVRPKTAKNRINT
ncbi:hypothetical protein BDE02_11G004900 [Populus trichocarpa]|nr:hypothetical protein BDE02_11G004900 [Populus trichocarpa]